MSRSPPPTRRDPHCLALPFICISSAGALIAASALSACIFSISYRYVHNDETRGTKYYGLFRFCYEPNGEMPYTGGIDWPHNEYSCHLRRRAPSNIPIDYRQFYSDFELCTLILISLAILSSFMAVAFSICTLYSPLCSTAHSLVVFIAAISSTAGFIVYTYHNELKENQMESTNGVLYMYHYGWAYYYTAASSAILLIAFVISLVSSALYLRHRTLLEEKRISMYL
ncbi:unnamed protein product, partial [Mesorhabditis belari]|uniref:Uncharacterized protein n=1 Tax=Mesorhabditis belari TaxID=2138241 RepID=A0AAF3FFL9_9BILA